MKKNILIGLMAAVLLLGSFAAKTSAADLRGLILINVDFNGEAWYVSPADATRYYLGRPLDALNAVKKLALGVTKNDVASFQAKIPARLLGKVVMAVDDAGKAYYLNPRDSKVYYLGSPANMLAVMKRVGTGIRSTDLDKILIAKSSQLPNRSTAAPLNPKYLEMEKIIQELVNDEREKNGLKRLKWNDELAVVARRHSQDQADENANLINPKKLCSYPFIHHEGIEVGLYHSDRLAYYKVYYQSASAENIALIPESRESSYRAAGIVPMDCQAEVNELNKTYEEDVKLLKTDAEKINRVKQEIISRANLTSKAPDIQVVENFNSTFEQIEQQAVKGWMNSPGHRKNILNGEYDEAGMGVANTNGYFIITQVFIKRAECGYKGGACCQKAGYYPFCYLPWGCDDNNICR
jgi:uncharacterized protein YkwD